MDKRLKRGDVRADGRVFWAYAKECKNGENWITNQKFLEKKKAASDRGKKQKALNQLKQNKHKHKRGDVREDGMIFWQYKPTRKKREYWITAEQYAEKNGKIKSLEKIHQKRKKTLRCGTVRGDGMIFWAYNRGMKNGEWWMSPSDFAAHKKSHAKRTCRNSKARRAVDPLYKFTEKVRNLVGSAMAKGGFSKNSRTENIIGCNFSEFSKYIESQFTEGMNWRNQGEWHMDHILPISAATTKEEVIALNHYTNFQPLWAVDNLRKQDKYDPAELKKYLESWNRKRKTESADLAANIREKRSQSKSSQKQQELFDLCALKAG